MKKREFHNIVKTHISKVPNNLMEEYDASFNCCFINLTQATIDVYNKVNNTNYKNQGKFWDKASNLIRTLFVKYGFTIETKELISTSFITNDGEFGISTIKNDVEKVGTIGTYTILLFDKTNDFSKVMWNEFITRTSKGKTMIKDKEVNKKKVLAWVTMAGSDVEMKSYYSLNKEHPRAYSVFTSLSKKLRGNFVREIWNWKSPVEIDIKNSVFQAVAELTRSTDLFFAIKDDKFIDRTSPDYNDIKKSLLTSLNNYIVNDEDAIYKLITKKSMTREKASVSHSKRKTLAKKALIKHFTKVLGALEANRIIEELSLKSISYNDLFKFEECMRDLARTNDKVECVHDAIYVDADTEEFDIVLNNLAICNKLYSIEEI